MSDVERLRAALLAAQQGCGGLLWLAPNKGHMGTADFEGLFDAAVDDARKGYEAACAALDAQPPAEDVYDRPAEAPDVCTGCGHESRWHERDREDGVCDCGADQP